VLKHDKKARALAKRTKDNFHGYNGIPTEEKSKRQAVENHTRQVQTETMRWRKRMNSLNAIKQSQSRSMKKSKNLPKLKETQRFPLKSKCPTTHELHPFPEAG
jgi:protein SPT2